MKSQNQLKVLCLGVLALGMSYSAYSQTTLKTAYQKDFLIGTALGTSHIEERNETANELIKREFNAITAENIMKSEVIHPEWSR